LKNSAQDGRDGRRDEAGGIAAYVFASVSVGMGSTKMIHWNGALQSTRKGSESSQTDCTGSSLGSSFFRRGVEQQWTDERDS
jgi:hypothetical protein